jgi:hypothetical protein
MAFTSWSYNATETLGDWYMHLRIHVDAPTACDATQSGRGRGDPHQAFAEVGMLSPQGITVYASSRTSWGHATVGPADADNATLGMVNSQDHAEGDFDRMAVSGDLEAGEHLFFWSSQGAGEGSYGGPILEAHLSCSTPFTIVERAVGRHPVLWDENTFTHGTNVGLLAGGTYVNATLSYEGTGPLLFAFTKVRADQGRLSLQSPGESRSWDLAGSRVLSDRREGLAGPVTLKLEETSAPIGRTVLTPWMNGVLTDYAVVDAFPGGQTTQS